MSYTNNISMIFPVGWTPTSPYLALPLLKGYAEKKDILISIFDLNIEFYDWILTQEVLLPLLKKAKSIFDSFNQQTNISITELQNYKIIYKILIYESYILEIEKWKKEFKQAKSPNKYKKTSKIIQASLNLVGFFYDMNISLNHLDSNKFNITNSEDLIAFAETQNIFQKFCSSKVINCKDFNKIIGISVTSRSQLGSALTLCRMIKQKDPTKILYLGGNLITRVFNGDFPDEMLLHFFKYIDFVNIYEGEVFLDYLQSVKCEEELYNAPNIVYMENSKIKRNALRKIHYCEYTIPNFDGFNLELYFTPTTVLPLVSSKNCYSRCAFCTIPFSSSNRNYHQYPMEAIVNAMDFLCTKYNTKYFMFNDEVFSMSRIINLATILVENGISYKWYCESRFDTIINRKDSDLISKGGCCHIQFGLESYNQRIINKMNKNINIKNIKPIIDNLLQSKISVHLFAIFGFPTELIQEMKNTKTFLLDFMQYSHNYYHMINASIGYGSFALEKGSIVYENPSDFGIEIVQQQDNFELSLNYHVKNGVSRKRINEFIKTFNYTSPLDIQPFKADQICLFNQTDDNFMLFNKEVFLKFNPINGELLDCKTYFNPNNGVFLYSLEKYKLNIQDILALYEFENTKRKFDIDYNYTVNPFLKVCNVNQLIDENTQKIYKLNNFVMKIYNLYKSYGFFNSMKLLLADNIITEEESFSLNSKLFNIGILIKSINL